MRRTLVILTAVAAMTGTADAAAPVRGGALCWDFDLLGADTADRLEGTSSSDHLAAYAGDDEVVLFAGDDCAATGLGNDVVHLGPGNDEAASGAGADQVFGGPGDDVLLPGLDADRADGGEGDDLIRDERGDTAPDVLVGGPGHDVIRAVNGAADTVECGPGYDVVIVDPVDVVSECDRIEIARRPRLSATAVRTGVRPSFLVRWTPGDLALPARVTARLVGAPSRRPGCAVGSWRLAGAASLRLAWRGLLPACPGDYAFSLTYAARASGGPLAACERLAGAPRRGCVPSESLGVVAVPVR